MKILVTGGNGQLGRALQKVLKNEETLFTDVDEMDITNKNQVELVFTEFKPDWLVHGAAYTNVDGCEESPELAEKINKTGTENLANACKTNKVKMIYISTDYIFDGTKKYPYTEEDEPNPQSVYGKTKLAGEKATLQLPDSYVLRTSWVYGDGKNFIKTMLALSEKMDYVRVVNDQFGRPTSAEDLAQAIYDVIKKQPIPGIYNISGAGDVVSWADFAGEIFTSACKKTRVVGISTVEYLSQNANKKIASRPKYSVFDLQKSSSAKILTRDWREGLRNYLAIKLAK